MKILGLTLVALVAFAANSVLNRAALIAPEIAPGAFTAIRLLSGAVMLGLLLSLRGQSNPLAHGSRSGAGALLLYAVGFSYAYVTLDAGVGALILFAGVQLTMFAGGLMAGQAPGAWRWVGSALGLTGLAILFLPGAAAPSAPGAALMVAAAVGWGIYSLLGQTATDPLAATAGNFLRAAPLAAPLLLLPGALEISPTGFALATASGALASGLGYAVWYSVLPRLEASIAAVAQLTVPLIALGGGMIFLGERPGLAFLAAAALVLSGVALAVLGPRLSKPKSTASQSGP